MSGNGLAVRRATPDDIEALRAVVPAIVAENTVLPPSPQRIDAVIQHCVHRVRGSLAGVIDGEDGQIAASIGLAFAEDYTSEVPFVQAVWCGLAPETRKLDKTLPPDDQRRHYGRRLFEFARWFHQSMEEVAGHPVIVRFDVTTRRDMAGKLDFFARNLKQVGGYFALGVPQAIASEFVDVTLSGRPKDWSGCLAALRAAGISTPDAKTARSALLDGETVTLSMDSDRFTARRPEFEWLGLAIEMAPPRGIAA